MKRLDRPFLVDIPESFLGPRITVRRWRDEDAPLLFDAVIESCAHIRRWLPWADSYQSVDDAVEFVRRQSGHWALHDHVGFGIFARADSKFLGGIGLTILNSHIPAFEIGYWLRQSAEGHGYISEATQLLTTFAFEDIGAKRVMIRCDARNDRSKAVPERLGYHFEGRHRNDSVGADGEVRDTLVFAMTPEAFTHARQGWS